MNTKTTYKTAIEYAIDNLVDAPADVVEKLEALKAQYEKRNSRERKPTEKQEQNAEIIRLIAEYLRENGEMTGAEIKNAIPECATFTPQKMTGLLRVGKDAGLFDRRTEKRVTYWHAI